MNASHDVYYGNPATDDDIELIEETPPSAVARFKNRADVVLHEGRYVLLNRDRTPNQAMVDDLLFIREALEAAGLNYLLVRGNDERPVIAVD